MEKRDMNDEKRMGRLGSSVAFGRNEMMGPILQTSAHAHTRTEITHKKSLLKSQKINLLSLHVKPLSRSAHKARHVGRFS